jgi:SAM-dependent methyltransferase
MIDDSNGYVTDVAYLPGFYPFMTPAVMRYVASSHGIAPPPHERFRFLELGCGLGTTLLTLAAADPTAHFTGVDFMPVHVDGMRRTIDACGLGNVELHCCDFADLPTEMPRYDFITLHGVFSWVSPETRHRLLEIIDRCLADDGIVEVTYNCMPGWSSLLPVRSMIRHFADRASGDSMARVRTALTTIAAMRKAEIPVFHDQPLAAQLVDRLIDTDPRYVAHEYLNEHWMAFETPDVMAMFAKIGLHHAGRLPVSRNHWQFMASQAFADDFMGQDPITIEVLKDFHANTMFRWDLFSRAPRQAWSPHERAATAAGIFFRVASAKASLPHIVRFGTVEAGLNGPPHDALLELMGQGSWSLEALLAASSLSRFTPEAIVEAIDVGVALGLFRVEGGPVLQTLPKPTPLPAGSLTVPSAFNRLAMLETTPVNEMVTLASPRTHGGHTIGDLYAVILDELVARGRESLEERLAARLTSLGKHLREQATGQPVTDEAGLTTALGEICETFFTTILPELVRVGIVAHQAV